MKKQREFSGQGREITGLVNMCQNLQNKENEGLGLYA